jgi:S1-C subfamily serine protease
VARDDHSHRTGTPAWVWGSIALAALALAATIVWWWQGQSAFGGGVSADKQAKLADVLAREQSLKTELEALTKGKPPHCPPGYIAEAERGPATAAADAPVPATAADGKLVPLSAKDMVEKLERATVLVLLPHSKGLATGTGFFISPQYLVTNRHVVESSSDGRVLLVSRTLERIRRGTIVAATDNSNPGSPDFALVRLEAGEAPGSLDINVQPTKLSEVIAAGYPGLVMRGDANFAKLVRDGDLSAAPDLSLTRGTIQSLQSSSAGTPIIVHTASILQGNSGGPLVDACGRVVGVNTFIAVDQQQSGRVSYAIQAQTMGTFVDRNGTAVKRDQRPCG